MVEDDGLTDLEMSAWRGFLEAHRRVTDVLEAQLREREDLPLAWYDVLVHLSESPTGSLRMQELADAILLSKSGLTRLVDRMQDHGLVERTPCPDDRRGIMAVLTEAGHARLREAATTHVAGVRAHFADLLRPGESAILSQALTRIAQAADRR